MFINTTDIIFKAVMNTEHCSHNFKNRSQQIGLFSYIQFFGVIVLTPLELSISLTTALCSSTFTLSSNTRSLLRRYTSHSVAREHKNSSLPARCLAVRWLLRHPLVARCVSARILPVGKLPVQKPTKTKDLRLARSAIRRPSVYILIPALTASLAQ
jgi:hypothetical protein